MIPIKNIQLQQGRGAALPIGTILQIIGAAPALDILLALTERPAPTKQLASGIEGFSARSVYRSLAMLEAHLLVERIADSDRRAGAANQLTEAGRLLLHSSSPQAPLRPLGELWELGIFKRLSYGPRPLLELVNGVEGLSYHQVRHRLIRYHGIGLVADSPHGGKERYFQLTDTTRSLVGIIAGVGRWRQRCAVTGRNTGLDTEEMATVLRTALSLAVLPDPIDLFVTEPDGAVRVTERHGPEAAGSAAATIDTWFAVLLDGNRGRVRVGGDLGLVDACLTQLHEVLREPSPHRAFQRPKRQ